MNTAALQTDKSCACKIHCKKLNIAIAPDKLNLIIAAKNRPIIFGANNSGRFNCWSFEPVETFEFAAGDKNPFEKLDKRLKKYQLSQTDSLHLKEMFIGGWAGYFGYELGRFIEKLPVNAHDDLEMPLISIGFYDKTISFDNITKDVYLFAIEIDGDNKSAAEKFAELENCIVQSQNIPSQNFHSPDIEKADIKDFRSNMDKNYYLEAMERIRKYIYDGDTYQINFSQRFEYEFLSKAIDLFCWQNTFNPSPYAAYIDDGKFKIISASPELFIKILDGIISTKPIKGTRPRTKDNDKNKINHQTLLDCEKEKAELNMIIDLERNDLGRICEYGTIKVVQQRTIEEYPTVFHAVATVEGRLRKEITFIDVMKAMFPGGSITGAPKIRSMEIIDELEPTARGIYTGSIGFIGIDGNVCLNIAIRTIIIKANRAYAQTGGGIVADSNPQQEWQETITKAKALLAGIKAVQK